MYRKIAWLGLACVAALSEGATIDIDVGEDGELKFEPNSTTAAQGDLLAFHFYTGGHSVVEAAFANPCVPIDNAFFSGYMTGDEQGDMTYLVTVNNTDPIWFYCSLDSHCATGMVGVVNPPSGNTVSDFANAAKSVPSASAPVSPQGGTSTSLLDATSTSGISTTSSSSSSTSTSTGAAVTHAAWAMAGVAGMAGGIAAMIL